VKVEALQKKRIAHREDKVVLIPFQGGNSYQQLLLI